jgi:hypothetical protein
MQGERRSQKRPSWIRRAIEREKELGPSVNQRISDFYDWVFVVLGPIALALGILALVWGYLVGLVLAAGGVWMTGFAFVRVRRWLSTRTSARIEG